MTEVPIAVQVHADDDVAVMLSDAAAGTVAAGVTFLEPIAKGHKVAVRSITAGAKVRKYGFPFGIATADIPAGAHVHVHNVKSALQSRDAYVYVPEPPADLPTDGIGRTFMGYPRADGRMATRKEIWVIPTVGCVGNLAERIAARASAARLAASRRVILSWAICSAVFCCSTTPVSSTISRSFAAPSSAQACACVCACACACACTVCAMPS